MRPIDKDVKYVCDYLRFRPGATWKWSTEYRRNFIDYLTFNPTNHKKHAPLEYELAQALRLGLIKPAARLEHLAKYIPITDYYGEPDDITF